MAGRSAAKVAQPCRPRDREGAPLRCLVVGRYPKPDLELVRRRVGDRGIELIAAQDQEQMAAAGQVEVIWRLFAGHGVEDPFVQALQDHPEALWVHTSSVGIDRMGELFHDRPNTWLTHSAGVTAVPIAEFVIACLLNHVKRLPDLREQQRQRSFEQLALRELGDLRLVLFGAGAIASEIALRLMPFGTQVVGVRRDPSKGAPMGFTQITAFSELEGACQGADALVLAAPLTEETRGAVGAVVLSALAPGSVLVNIARGGLVDDQALLLALSQGRPAAAYLDAFQKEPLPEDSELWSAPGVFISPHLSWSSPNFERRSSDLFAAQLCRWLDGDPLINLADPRLGY